MNRKKSKLLILTLALTSVLMTAVIVNAKPLYGEMTLYFMAPGPVHPVYGPPLWSGTITGDITGEMFFYGTGYKDVGHVHFFEEIWLITAVGDWDDTLLTGTDTGVLSFAKSGGIMNGVVTEAYGDYEHLIGHNVHMSGDVTWDSPGVPDECLGAFRVN